jgi:hypothetical protein
VLTHLKITQSVSSTVLIITPFVSTIIFTMIQDVCWTRRIIIFRTNNLIKLHQVLALVNTIDNYSWFNILDHNYTKCNYCCWINSVHSYLNALYTITLLYVLTQRYSEPNVDSNQKITRVVIEQHSGYGKVKLFSKSKVESVVARSLFII